MPPMAQIERMVQNPATRLTFVLLLPKKKFKKRTFSSFHRAAWFGFVRLKPVN